MISYWGRVTLICVGNLTIIVSYKGFSPGRCQAIIWPNAGMLLIWPWETKFNEISIKIHTFSFFRKMAAILSRSLLFSGKSAYVLASSPWCVSWVIFYFITSFDIHGLFLHVGINCMMTLSYGNIFRVTGPLCGEFTGPGEFPTQRPVTRSFDVLFDLRLNTRLSKQPWGWWFEMPSWSLWRHRNGYKVLGICSYREFSVHPFSQTAKGFIWIYLVCVPYWNVIHILSCLISVLCVFVKLIFFIILQLERHIYVCVTMCFQVLRLNDKSLPFCFNAQIVTRRPIANLA